MVQKNLSPIIQKNASNGANMTTKVGRVKSRQDKVVGENKDWQKKSESGQGGRKREGNLCTQCQFC